MISSVNSLIGGKRVHFRFVNVHGDIHKSISRILREHRDGAWLTFKQVPREEVARMYDRFRTRWTWDPTNEEALYEGFLNVLKRLFKDITMQLRIKATKLAYEAGEKINPSVPNQFRIICKYPPESIPINIWRDMCSSWNTKEWLDKSKTESSNRKSGDINCGRASSRHTGGSMGFDERRDNWKRTYDREPSWKEIFLQTHLTKKCKEVLRKRDISIYDMKNLEFCTDESREAYGGYLEAMHDLHGSDFTEVPDDPGVWARVQAGGRRIRVYGVGSLDLHYMVTGTSSSSSGCASSSIDYQRSQEEAQAMRTELEDIQARLENETKAREDLMARFEIERKAREDLQQHINEAVKRELQDFMKNWRSSN
ncbi:uncharacterized protein LOC110889668 isoform X3 [Helianthus annuus]|uniref:uncharacterized protein LOC110889668 isoform X3 n=1 Tax=Helianthus annuus TaxID=4232 RepID=UPI000B8F73B2|nr:uncharacterized protein LOC110889668 isoform X3 [Helianthus annuus]